jgi:uncharacterized protein
MEQRLFIPHKPYALAWFFFMAFAIAWGFWIPAALASKGLVTLPIPVTLAGLLGAWGPSLASILFTWIYDGTSGLRLLFKRLFIWRVRMQWYLFVILWPAVHSLLVTAILIVAGTPTPDFASPPVVSVYPAPPEAFAAGFLPLLPLVFVIQFFGSSLGEELGWRGFALPRLQAQQGWLLASGILGLIWGVWHLPRIWMPGEPFELTTFAWVIVGSVLNTALYTWVFNHTRGSLLPVLLLHTAQAVTLLFLTSVSNPLVENALMVLLILLIVTRSNTVRGLRKANPAARKIP